MPLNRSASVAVQAAYGEGPSVQPFGFFGTATPELNNGSRQLAFNVAVHYAR